MGQKRFLKTGQIIGTQRAQTLLTSNSGPFEPHKKVGALRVGFLITLRKVGTEGEKGKNDPEHRQVFFVAPLKREKMLNMPKSRTELFCV